ncbi:MAG: hypothetical protein JWM95_2785, partial [Gemmatimonadetes bacterium]|nr:hypothetical protein [Gemmatimonadota bacterium]
GRADRPTKTAAESLFAETRSAKVSHDVEVGVKWKCTQG